MHSQKDNPVSEARHLEGAAFTALFCLTIPAANWLVGNLGTQCHDGLCLIPIAPGLMAPSGVLMVGIALVLRDLVQRRLGAMAAAVAIVVGGIISALIAPPALVIASTVAFLVSEFADLAVYTPMARRGYFVGAVLASGFVGLFVDSILFLSIAFGSLQYLSGQVAGKAVMILASLPLIYWLRGRDERMGFSSSQ
jgi:uncharacterized PurR-regulated membrane protein YhhQ (DUF165 family)